MGDELIYVPPVVPVFPLPGVVLFPHTIIPLHVFEPRYREMVADALAGERVIAMALLKQGWERRYHSRQAPVHPTVGVGRILESEQTSDGNYNLLLRGIGRAMIVEECASETSYRQARIEPVETYCSATEDAAQRLRTELFGAIQENPGLDPPLQRNWLRLREAALQLGELVDLLAAGLPADPELRQLMLGEPDDLLRGETLLEQIRTLAAMARTQRRAARPQDVELN
jgi:Lon protease-like protein